MRKTGCGEDRKFLPTYQGVQSVNSGYTGLDKLLRITSGCRIHRQAIDISSLFRKDLRTVINGTAQSVKDTAQHIAGYTKLHASSQKTYFTVGKVDTCGTLKQRHSYIIAVGGGAFLDVAGFAAATAHRGIRLLRIPTTTLSQADSGVGVKNGINFMGRKNYLGTFAVAWATLDDFLFLHSQPLPLKRAGLAEVVKVAVVKDASFFNWLETNASALAVCERDALEYAVEHSALLHASHIACGGDAFELGSSRPLDFGHWAAHYMETMSGYILGHAEAVSVGMCLDILYSVRKGWLPAAEAERIISVLKTLELPVFHPLLSRRTENGACEVLKGLEAFREHLGGHLTVLMLTGIGRGKDVHEIDAALMEECIREMQEAAGYSVQE